MVLTDNDIHGTVVCCLATKGGCKMILKAGAFSYTMVARYFIPFLKIYDFFSGKKKIFYKVIHERVNNWPKKGVGTRGGVFPWQE